MLNTGAVIDKKFTVLTCIGKGGMGAIYKCNQEEPDRIVAVKFLENLNPSDLDTVSRFEREGKILAALSHKGIAQFYSYGFGGITAYIAMEYIEGKSLKSLLNEKDTLTVDELVPILKSVCLALAHAHEVGVVHRDLKPENIMLTDDPEQPTKLIDFGLAKVVLDESEFLKLTQTGQLVGSTNYLSPEICFGKKAGVGSDLYSLGCIGYEAVTGIPPFSADNPIGVIYKHMNEKPEPYATKTKDELALQTILLRCLEKNPADRYSSAAELSTQLQRIIDGQSQLVIESGNSFSRTQTLPVHPQAGQSSQTMSRALVVLIVCIVLAIIAVVMTR